jgi:arsenite methyltransferase
MKAVSLDLDTEDLAQLYERVSADRQFKAGRRLIEELKVSVGESVLDLGCGTGLLAEYIAGIVGTGGSVTGIDPLPLRIEIAQGRARPNLSFKTGNAYDLSGFAPATFDAVCLNAVFHWLPEKKEPLRQIYRVLKSGGRIGISTGAKGSPNPLHEIKQRVLSRESYKEYPAAAQTAVHRVSAEELSSLLIEAGFTIQALEERPSPQPQLAPEAAIRFSEASSFGNFLGHLPAKLRERAREDLKRELEQTDVRASRERLRLIAIAVKP